MAFIIAVIIVVVLFAYSPVIAIIFGCLAALYFYKSMQRTDYMTDEEVDIARNLESIRDPDLRKSMKAQIEKNIDERMLQDKVRKNEPKLHDLAIELEELLDTARSVVSLTLFEVFETKMDDEEAAILSSGVGDYLFGQELDELLLKNYSFNEIQNFGNLIMKNEPEFRELVVQSLRIGSGIEYVKGNLPEITQLLSVYGSQYPNSPTPKSYEVLVDWAINNLTNPESIFDLDDLYEMYREEDRKFSDVRKFREFEARLTKYMSEALSLELTTLETAKSEAQEPTMTPDEVDLDKTAPGLTNEDIPALDEEIDAMTLDRPDITKIYSEIVQTASKFIEASLVLVSEINEAQSKILVSFELGVIDALAQRANLEFDDSLKIMKTYLTEVKGMSVTEEKVEILYGGLSNNDDDLENIREGGEAVYDWLEGNANAPLKLVHLLSIGTD